ncbi:MAG: TonB-dependent receptor [Vicingaceae bacterium]
MFSQKRVFNYALFLLCCILFLGQDVFSQSKIQVIDKETKAPIFLTHVKFTAVAGTDKGKFKWLVSDEDGFALNPFNDTTMVVVSFVGFQTTTTILLPNQTKIIGLKPSAFDLDEMVVSAQFEPVELHKSVYEVKTIGKEKIEEKGATNLRETLNNELSFKTNNGHVNETAINLNGLTGNHVKFMIDGVPVEGRLNGNIDLSQINLNEVEKVEIIEGPSSVAYGTNALGGVINVITKKHQFKKINVGVKTYYESIGQYNISGKVGWKEKNNLFKISGGRNFFSGFANTDTSRYKDWKPREQYFGRFMYSRRFNYLKLSYIVDGFTELMTSRGEPTPPYKVTAFDTHYRTKRLSNKLLLTGPVFETNYLNVTLSHSYFERSRNIYFKDLTTLDETITASDSDQDTTIFNNYLARAVFNTSKDSAKLNTMIGAEFKLDKIKAERVVGYNQDIGDYAVFGHLKFAPIKSLIIQPAVRYSYNTRYKAPIVPSINFLFNVGKSTNIRASYAKGFRAPDLKELYLEFHFNSTINLFGNENLESENSDHFNLSLDYHKAFKGHSIRIVPKVFYSKINNLIFLEQSSPVNWTYTNVDFLTTQGVGLAFNYNFKNFDVKTAYSYYGNYNSQFDNGKLKNDFFYSNDAIVSAGFKFDSLDLKVNLSYKYTGTIKSYYLDDNDIVTESFIGDYNTFDFSLTKKMFHQKMSLTVGVKNMFDVKEVDMVGDVFGVSNAKDANRLNVLWGRSYFVSLSYNF